MQVASAYVRELYAITESVKKWRQYLIGRKLKIFTDQRSLKHLLSQVVQTPEQYKWATKLLGYDFEIFYKPGKENRVADALSRILEPIVFAISTVQPDWVEALKGFYNSVEEYHSSVIGGHSGIKATVKRLSSSFTWPKLKADVSDFIRKCETCQQVKYPNHKSYGLLQALPALALYGRSVPDFNPYIPGSSDTPSIDFSLQELGRLRVLLKNNLKRAQQRMTSLANACRIDKTFSVGDMVYLRLKDYRQCTVSFRQSKKLAKRFYGPFKILERIGQVAYKLELPQGSRIHPVFHVSLLRQAHGNPTSVPLPEINDLGNYSRLPEVIIDERGEGDKREVLVSWKNKPMEEATWERYSNFQAEFPTVMAAPRTQLEDDLFVKSRVLPSYQAQLGQLAGPKERPINLLSCWNRMAFRRGVG
ncbi:uncharacterized protein LOC143577694 [Bidens hawaiensis]|uniref:uncharacterized protein LOC143577694 n=1 Tax=Bidens hawaiensis TaxID=980011 RepID=UPI00404B7DD7